MAIDSSDNFIDPRDVGIEADEYEDSIECKLEEISTKELELADLDEDEDSDEYAEIECELKNLHDELEGLKEEAEDILELRDECNNYAGGETLINEDYWVDYCRQMAEDCDGVDTANWPYNCIDWEQAADQLAMDYTIITWRGNDFYVRS